VAGRRPCVQKSAPLGIARDARFEGLLSVFEKVLPQDGWEIQSHLRAVFLAKVDMDGVLDD
jgi:hypothetical protein